MKLKRLITLSAVASAGATLMLLRILSRRVFTGQLDSEASSETERPQIKVRKIQEEGNPHSREPQQKRPKLFTMVLIVIGVILIVVSMLDLMIRGPQQYPVDPTWSVRGGDPKIGREAVVKHGCGACHVIPGIPTARGRVGPQLEDFRIQTYVGGVLPNTPENLVAWIQNPPAASPRTAMPNLGITEEVARHIAAYLYSATGRGRFFSRASQ